MEVNYTLPGLLPEPAPAPAAQSEEGPAEPFGALLRRLRAPEVTDWRALLRLNIPPPGAAGIGPPTAPRGIESRDGVSQRAWWRVMLHKHTRLLESTSQDAPPDVHRMLGLLLESQRLEEKIFARHFAEAAD